MISIPVLFYFCWLFISEQALKISPSTSWHLIFSSFGPTTFRSKSCVHSKEIDLRYENIERGDGFGVLGFIDFAPSWGKFFAKYTPKSRTMTNRKFLQKHDDLSNHLRFPCNQFKTAINCKWHCLDGILSQFLFIYASF